MARIFDPMFSTSREGCGLGLPIVKRIVDSHNGTITVSSSQSVEKVEARDFRISICSYFHDNMEVMSEPVTCS